jgi:2-polyprenyl-6-hydroxyphenyl methylase/3-demethylubiquinone-9 3-methyltransferase
LPKFSECKDFSLVEKNQFRPDADGHIFLLHADEMKLIAKTAKLSLEKLLFFTNSLTNGSMKLAPVLPHLPAEVVRRAEILTRSLPLPAKVHRKLHAHTIAVLKKVDLT